MEHLVYAICINVYRASSNCINVCRAHYSYMNIYGAYSIWMNIYRAFNICMNCNGAPNICMDIYGASNACMNMYVKLPFGSQYVYIDLYVYHFVLRYIPGCPLSFTPYQAKRGMLRAKRRGA